MKTTNHYFNLKFAALVALSMLLATGLQAATLFENFDSPPTLYSNENSSGGIVTYNSGNWYCLVNKMSDVDHYNGDGGIRLRGLTGKNMLEMKFDKQGAGVVSFLYASYSVQSGGSFILQKSTDQGSNWIDIGSVVTVPLWNGTFHTYSQRVDIQGNIRFRLFTTITSNANTKINIDDFMITDYGTEQVAMPTSSVPTEVYETNQAVTLTSATDGATIYYTIDGTAPTTSSSIYSIPLNISTTTKIRAIAVAAGKVDSREEIVIINIPIEISTIASLYNFLPTSGTNLQYYKYTGEAIVTASYTATYKTLFLQDNTAGILISDVYKYTTQTNDIGDKITNIIAQVNRINDSPQLYPYNNFTVISSGNSVTPPVVTLADVPNRTYQLVQINDLYFDEADGTKYFVPSSPYKIHDASIATTTTTFRTPLGMPDTDYRDAIIPAKRNIICLVAKNGNSSNPNHYIFARNAADLNVQASGFENIKQFDFSVSNGKIHFETLSVEKVNVFSINGQLIKSINSSVGRNSIALNKGIYIIRIGEKSEKVAIY